MSVSFVICPTERKSAKGRKREKETISLVPWLFSPLRFTSLCARIQDREGQTGVRKKGAKGRRDGLAREEAWKGGKEHKPGSISISDYFASIEFIPSVDHARLPPFSCFPPLSWFRFLCSALVLRRYCARRAPCCKTRRRLPPRLRGEAREKDEGEKRKRRSERVTERKRKNEREHAEAHKCVRRA